MKVAPAPRRPRDPNENGQDGRFEIEFDDKVRTDEPGDAVFIPDGEEHRHRARVLTEVARVVFVEDI